ncbi:unnamed protein product [Moneuplotes crassus]|uniref:Uncharacterized protein n=1 Tax=Euplotes crassus TaxID=5936 RepID=A0AAD1Y7V1_EUPCR|nr:unnamed protein product [Moneuplotes crassus]
MVNLKVQKVQLPDLSIPSKGPSKKRSPNSKAAGKIFSKKQVSKKMKTKKNEDLKCDFLHNIRNGRKVNPVVPRFRINRGAGKVNPKELGLNKTSVMNARKGFNIPIMKNVTGKLFKKRIPRPPGISTKKKICSPYSQARLPSPGLRSNFKGLSPASRNIFTPKQVLSSISPAKYEVFTKDCTRQSSSRYETSEDSFEEEKQVKKVFMHRTVRQDKTQEQKTTRPKPRDTSRQLYDYLNDVNHRKDNETMKSPKMHRKQTNFFYEISKTIKGTYEQTVSRNNRSSRQYANVKNMKTYKKINLSFMDSTFENIVNE